MTIQDFIDNLKKGYNYKLAVTPSQSAAIQGILQVNDITWVDGDTKISYTHKPYLDIKQFSHYTRYFFRNDIADFNDSTSYQLCAATLLKEIVYSANTVNLIKDDLKIVFNNIYLDI